MASDFVFDPITKDFVRDGKGGWQKTPTAATVVMHQLWCHAFKCWHDAELGSLIYDLSNFQANPAVLAADELRRSLGILVGRGRIANLQTKAELEKPGRLVSLSTFQDVATGQPVDVYSTAGGK